jgi:hypothetical protein
LVCPKNCGSYPKRNGFKKTRLRQAKLKDSIAAADNTSTQMDSMDFMRTSLATIIGLATLAVSGAVQAAELPVSSPVVVATPVWRAGFASP